MTDILKIGRPMDVEGMIEATTARPPMGVVSIDIMMITTTIIMVMTAMDIAVGAVTVAAEEVYTSVV